MEPARERTERVLLSALGPRDDRHRHRRRRHSRFSSRRRRRNRLCIPDGIRDARGSLKTCMVVVFSITQGCRLTVFVD